MNFLTYPVHQRSEQVSKVEYIHARHCTVKRSSVPSSYEFVLVQMGLLL